MRLDLRYREFLRSILGNEFYYRISNESLLELEKTLDGLFQVISSNDANDKAAADMFHVQPEQMIPEMRRLAREIRGIRNST